MKIILSLIITLSSFCLFGQEESFDNGSSWQEVLKTGKGKLIIHWHPNNNYDATKKTVMDGVEDALFRSFIEYTERENNVQIEIDRKLSKNFNDVLYYVSNSQEGVFGSSSISITSQRREILNFTKPHFPDIYVLISNGQFPMAKTHQDFKEMFEGAVMISIPNTTMEQELLQLNTDLSLKSSLVFVNSGGDIIGEIESVSNSMGYLDLANFMTAIKKNSFITRQYFYPIRLEGLAFIYPLDSDWKEPIDDYYSSPDFLVDKERIINEFLGEDVNDLVDRISKSAEIGPYEEIILLTEEKEFQAKELLASALREQKRQHVVYWLIAGVFLVIIMALIIYIRYQIKVKANDALLANQMLTERHNKQLLSLNQEKNDLIRILAHDLRNPINQLMGFSELLLQNSAEFKGDQLAMLGFMKQSSEKLRDMINKILDVDAIEAGNRNVILEELKAEIILLAVFNDFNRIAEAKNIVLKHQVESGIVVLADKVYLTQILENLISNAIKFSNSKTEVLLSVKALGEEVVFSVKDQGPGFSKHDQERIFKKYQQLSAKSTAGEPSTGLGLSIVKMFAEMMGGSVTYQTKEGVGTTFNVSLPRVK